MIRLRNIYIASLLLCFAPQVSAQTYDVAERRNPWNSGANAAGIRMDTLNVSYAELYGEYTGSDFRDYYEADRSWNAGAVAKTVTHTKKYSMKGAFAFDHTSGDNMCGSMFIHPGYYPVDVLEFTPGRKTLQTYSFSGAVSGEIAPKWRMGASIDFASANYAKRRDLRHSNYRLDLNVAPGVMYYSGDFAAGFAYIFGKNTERVRAETIGTATPSSDYMAFLDKGLMYGVSETWEGSGIHLSETGVDGLPVKEFINGAALQFQWRSLYTDVEYRFASGSAGEKQTIWFEFPTHRISSHISYRFGKGKTDHFVRLNIDWSRQVNNENDLVKISSGGSSIVYIQGSDRIFERNVLSFNPEYEAAGRKGEIIAGVEFTSLKRLATQMYPYVFSQSMFYGSVYASGTLHAGRFDVKAGLAFAAGNYTDRNRRVPIDSEPGDPPSHLTDYYNLQNEYMTASRLTMTAALRWNFYKWLYAEAGVEYTRAFDLKYISGANRLAVMLKLGYTF